MNRFAHGCGGMLVLLPLLWAYGCSSSDAEEDPTESGAASLACEKQDLGSFQPKWRPSGASLQKKCTADQRRELFDACLGQGSSEKRCDEYKAKSKENADCAACVITGEDASVLGPVIVSKKLGTLRLNVAGCIAAAAADPEGKGCAGHVQAAEQCEESVCAECPSKEEASYSAFQSCLESARTGLCKTYAEKTRCAEVRGDKSDDPAAKSFAGCVKDGSFRERYEQIAIQLCGGI